MPVATQILDSTSVAPPQTSPQPQRFFIIAGLLFGLTLCVLTPPFAVPDEPAHFFRAWSVSRGQWSTQRGGAMIPRSYVRLASSALEDIRGANGRRFRPSRLRELAHIPLEPNDLIFVPIPAESWRHPLQYTAGSYPPIGYAASGLSIAVSRMFGLPPLIHLYAARISNLLLAALLIWLAIGRTPFGRWTIALCALIPMSMYMQASASLDALTIAVSLLVIAEALRFAFAPRQNVASIITVAFLLGSIKPGYLLIPMLAIVTPAFRRRWPAILAVFGAAVSGSVLAGIWASPALGNAPSPSIQPSERLHEALHHPLAFAFAFAADWSDSFTIRLTEMIGTFGWLDAPVPLPFAVIALLAMALVATADGPAPIQFRGLRRFIPWLLFAGTLTAITLASHLYSPAPKFALAIQGRYFLPALPLLFLPLIARKEPRKWVVGAACTLVMVFALQTIFTELLRFYV